MQDSQACDRCHRRKTRCDKARPSCGPCRRVTVSCVYSEKTRRPFYGRDFVENLERRLCESETANRALKERLTAAESNRGHAVVSLAATLADGTVDAETSRDTGSRNDDVANEVSYLSTSAGGGRQFLGPASGLHFANLVRATVSPSIAGNLDPPPDHLTSAGPIWTVEDRSLPSQQFAWSLIEAYLAHDHLSYPFLHPNSVREAVRAIYNDNTYYVNNPFEAFMFDMLLAIATSQVHKFNWQALPDAETHHRRAMKHLNALLANGGLRALQAMLLICQLRMCSTSMDDSASLWHIVGMSARMCIELGLHRESAYTLKPGTHREGDAASQFEEQEIRRRCFWCVFALDRIVSITLGRPLAIQLDDLDVNLPVADLEISQSPLPASAGGSGVCGQVNLEAGNRTAIFSHIIRYRTLCGKMLTSLHRGVRNTSWSEADVIRCRSELAAELESWHEATDQLDLPEMNLSLPLYEARSSFRSRTWYEMLYHNGVLLLYRPSSASFASGSPEDNSNLQKLFTAAKQSITLYAHLFRSRKINCSWNTLHSVFMAGLSYVYSLSRHFRDKRRRLPPRSEQNTRGRLSREPTISEIVTDCRACSNVLVAVSERCQARKNCHGVFDRLSDAVIADAVDSLSQGSRPEDTASFSSMQTQNERMSAPVTQGQIPMQGSYEPFSTISNPAFSAGVYESLPSAQSMLEGPALAADTALRDCFTDLQEIYDMQWGDDAILQLSTDWLGEIGHGFQPTNVGSA